MLLKYVAAGLTASALLAGAAFAETSGTMSQSSLQGSTWRASKVVGLSVYNDKNEKIGSINDLLMDKSGSIKAAVIGVGGFLGVGEHLVAVSFDKIKFSNEPVSNTTASNANPPPASNRPAGATTTGAANNATSQPAATSKPNPWYPDHAVFNADKDELQKMQEFKYSTE
jgi:sporulation protein YlmC with PRC-barrel domain